MNTFKILLTVAIILAPLSLAKTDDLLQVKDLDDPSYALVNASIINVAFDDLWNSKVDISTTAVVIGRRFTINGLDRQELSARNSLMFNENCQDLWANKAAVGGAVNGQRYMVQHLGEKGYGNMVSLQINQDMEDLILFLIDKGGIGSSS